MCRVKVKRELSLGRLVALEGLVQIAKSQQFHQAVLLLTRQTAKGVHK